MYGTSHRFRSSARTWDQPDGRAHNPGTARADHPRGADLRDQRRHLAGLRGRIRPDPVHDRRVRPRLPVRRPGPPPRPGRLRCPLGNDVNHLQHLLGDRTLHRRRRTAPPRSGAPRATPKGTRHRHDRPAKRRVFCCKEQLRGSPQDRRREAGSPDRARRGDRTPGERLPGRPAAGRGRPVQGRCRRARRAPGRRRCLGRAPAHLPADPRGEGARRAQPRDAGQRRDLDHPEHRPGPRRRRSARSTARPSATCTRPSPEPTSWKAGCRSSATTRCGSTRPCASRPSPTRPAAATPHRRPPRPPRSPNKEAAADDAERDRRHRGLRRPPQDTGSGRRRTRGPARRSRSTSSRTSRCSAG